MSRKKNRNIRPNVAVASNDAMVNAANVLFANIQFSSIDSPIKVVAVTSSVPNEGKTTVAISLAAAVGQAGKTCLLIEGDMRRRSLRSALSAQGAGGGIHSLLTGKVGIEKALAPTKIPGVKFLDAEGPLPTM